MSRRTRPIEEGTTGAEQNPKPTEYLIDKFIGMQRSAESDQEISVELSKAIVPQVADQSPGSTYDPVKDIAFFAVDGGTWEEGPGSFMLSASKGALQASHPSGRLDGPIVRRGRLRQRRQATG